MIKRAASWVINLLPIRIVRLCWFALWNRDDTLNAVGTGWLPYRIRAPAFFASAAIVFAFGVSLNPVYKSEVTWFDVLTNIDSHDAATVWEKLDFPPDLLETLFLENVFQGTSDAAKSVRAKVGSEDGLKFAIYVSTLDNRLGSLLAAKAITLQRLQSYEEKAMAAMFPFIIQVAIVPLYFVGNILRRSFVYTRNVWLTMQATWLFPIAIMAALGGTIPFGHDISSLLLALFEGTAMVTLIVYHYKGFHLTHEISKGRFVVSLLLGFAANLAVLIAVAWILDTASARLEHYLT